MKILQGLSPKGNTPISQGLSPQGTAPSRLKLASAATLAVAIVAAAPALGVRQQPARIQVVAKEFELGQSRYTLRAGPAIIELVNSGEDEHDLALRRRAPDARTIRIASTLPGGIARVQAKLAPGRYLLWCTLADHRGRGMHAHLTVVRRASQ
jgi:hypothetical protein